MPSFTGKNICVGEITSTKWTDQNLDFPFGGGMEKAADIYLRQCSESEKLPDVFEFLATQDGLSERAQIDVLLVDQFQRWKNHQTIPVDQYLERTPSLDDVLKVELLIEEYGYLDQRGVAPAPEEFAKRFGSLSPDAMQELCDALEIESSLEEPGIGGSDSTRSDSVSESESSQQLIGRYKVLRTLGKGEFGRVYLAKDPDLDRSVAIKVPTQMRIDMGGGADEFLNEARSVAKLDHPNIVPVYDFGVSPDGSCFVVSKYIRGKELRSEIRKSLPHRESAQIIATLARALHVAHVAGIVHRDVKPGNIILDSKHQPHLLDFGLALRDQDEFESNALVGTPAYMSPEQAMGGGHRIDGRSDIYSLGVVFYEMLTGRRPCKSDKRADVMEQLKHGAVRPPRQSDDTIPVELEQICMKALSRQLNERYSTAKDMADALEGYLFETGSEFDSSDGLGSSSVSRSGRSTRQAQPTSTNTLTEKIASPFGIAIAVLMIAAIGSFLLSDKLWPETTNPINSSTVNPGTNGSKGQPEIKSSNRLAVLGFRNISSDAERDWISTGLTELLTVELEKSHDVDVVSSENVYRVKADLDLANSESLGESALNRLKQRTGARWIVLGSFTPEGVEMERLRLDVVVQDTETTSAIANFSQTILTDDWAELVVSSGAQIRKHLTLAPPDVTKSGHLGIKMPVNDSAVRSYFEGLVALRRFDAVAAKTLFEQAAKDDPNSAMVQDALAKTLSLLGNDLLARQVSNAAVKLSKSIDPPDRLRIAGRNYLLNGKPAEAAATFRELFESQDNSLDAALLLGNALIASGQGRAVLELVGSMKEQPLHGSQRVKLELLAAQAAESLSEYAMQVNHARTSAKLSDEIGARLTEGEASLLEGEAQRKLGEHQEAIKCFDHAYELFIAHGDQPHAAKVLGAWGKALVDNGDFDTAESKLHEAIQLSEKLANRRLSARHTGQLGELDIYRGKFEEASKLLREALETFIELGDRHGIADMNLTLANVMARQGEPEKAVEMIGDARKAFQQSGDRRGEARTWGQQGAIHGRKGEIVEAQRHFERALELFREVSDRRGEATVLGDLASTFSNQGDLKKAGELYSNSLELHRQMASKRGPALVMYNLGILYLRTGRIEESKQLVGEALANFERQGNHMNACFVQRKLGEIETLNGDLAKSDATLNAALKNSRKVGSGSVEAQALASLGIVAAYRGQLDEAVQLQQESRALRKKLKQSFNASANDLILARLALQKGDVKQAASLYEKAADELSTGKPDWEAIIIAFRSRVESANGEKTEAANTLKEALESFQNSQSQDVGVRLVAQHELARAHAAMVQDQNETELIEETLNRFDEVIQLAKQRSANSVMFEAQIERMEFLSRIDRVIETSEFTALQATAAKSGFTDIASRAEQLAKRE